MFSERNNPYPHDRPLSVINMGAAQYGHNDIRSMSVQYSVGNTRYYKVTVQNSFDNSLRVAKEINNLNELIAWSVHGAHDTLKAYFSVNKPEWENCLRETCLKDAVSFNGMFVNIDKITDTTQEYGDYGSQKSYKICFDFPRIQNFRGTRRCVYVSSINVKSELDCSFRTKLVLEIEVRDDSINEDISPMFDGPYRPRNGYIDTPLRSSGDVTDPSKVTEEEKLSLELLRECLTERAWRRYLKRGFVVVRGASGKEYQLFKNKWHTKVRDKGKVVSEVCSRLTGNVPLTDNVIAFKTMIETDEKHFEKVGNVYKLAVGL